MISGLVILLVYSHRPGSPALSSPALLIVFPILSLCVLPTVPSDPFSFLHIGFHGSSSQFFLWSCFCLPDESSLSSHPRCHLQRQHSLPADPLPLTGRLPSLCRPLPFFLQSCKSSLALQKGFLVFAALFLFLLSSPNKEMHSILCSHCSASAASSMPCHLGACTTSL